MTLGNPPFEDVFAIEIGDFLEGARQSQKSTLKDGSLSHHRKWGRSGFFFWSLFDSATRMPVPLTYIQYHHSHARLSQKSTLKGCSLSHQASSNVMLFFMGVKPWGCIKCWGSLFGWGKQFWAFEYVFSPWTNPHSTLSGFWRGFGMASLVQRFIRGRRVSIHLVGSKRSLLEVGSMLKVLNKNPHRCFSSSNSSPTIY